MNAPGVIAKSVAQTQDALGRVLDRALDRCERYEVLFNAVCVSLGKDDRVSALHLAKIGRADAARECLRIQEAGAP